jgi:hypothetical protein
LIPFSGIGPPFAGQFYPARAPIPITLNTR